MSKTWGNGGDIICPAQNIYEESSTQKHALGSRLKVGERVYKYALAGEAHVPGKCVQSPVCAADHTGLAVATATAGATTLTITNGASTAVTANMYADGWLWADTGTNVGHVYKIKSNTAALVNVAFTATLYDPIIETLTNATETLSLHRNPYSGLIIHASVPTAIVVGVPPIDITDAYYYWLQVSGPCSILTEDTVVIGQMVGPGDDDDGAVQAADSYTEQIIGTVMRVEGNTEYSLIMLDLDW